LEVLSDDVVLVWVEGEVDQLTLPDLSSVIGAALPRARRMVLVDMSRVSFLSSAGLAVLVEASNRAQESDLRLVVVAGNHPVTRAMAVTGLDSMIPVYPSQSEALQALTANGTTPEGAPNPNR
jgi:anti-anti-sigma factor